MGHSFIYDGANLVGEYNNNTSTWDTEYTYGNGLIDKQGTGGTEYQFYDGLGDVYQTLNAAGNYVLSGEVSDDFGQHFGPTGTLGTDDLFYKWRGDYGYRWDGDGLWTGSYNEPIVEVGARYYMPSMGVFLTRDEELSQRPYEYCDADPVNNIDPSGHDTVKITYKNNPDGSVSETTTTMHADGTTSTTTSWVIKPGDPGTTEWADNLTKIGKNVSYGGGALAGLGGLTNMASWTMWGRIIGLSGFGLYIYGEVGGWGITHRALLPPSGAPTGGYH